MISGQERLACMDTEQNGAAVLYLTVHAEEQIGTEAVDDSTVPEENAEMEQVP